MSSSLAMRRCCNRWARSRDWKARKKVGVPDVGRGDGENADGAVGEAEEVVVGGRVESAEGGEGPSEGVSCDVELVTRVLAQELRRVGEDFLESRFVCSFLFLC